MKISLFDGPVPAADEEHVVDPDDGRAEEADGKQRRASKKILL